MNMKTVKFRTALALVLLLSFSSSAHATVWNKQNGYWDKTGHKLTFGLKHSFCSLFFWWTESREPQYNKEWQGFTVGLGKSLTYTAGGIIHLVTFPIPVDFPNMGIGLHIPNKECPHRHDENYIPGGNDPKIKPAGLVGSEVVTEVHEVPPSTP